MKRFLLFLILLLLAVRYPMVANAQTVREEGGGVGAGDLGTGSRPAPIMPMWVGGRTDDSVSTALRFDANGNLKVLLGNAPQDWYFRQNSIISNDLVIGNRDSSAVYQTLGANKLTLFITAAPDTTVANKCWTMWAIQVRRHQDTSTDSLSMWPWQKAGNVALATYQSTATTDSIGSTANFGTSVRAVTAQWPGEFIVTVPISEHTPRKQVSIDLVDSNGAPFTARLMSVRARLIGVMTGTACATALTSANGRANIRIDLEGYR